MKGILSKEENTSTNTQRMKFINAPLAWSLLLMLFKATKLFGVFYIFYTYSFGRLVMYLKKIQYFFSLNNLSFFNYKLKKKTFFSIVFVANFVIISI